MRTAARALLCLSLVLAAPSLSRGEVDAALFRVFLLDGTSVVSYGQFARVPGSVIFSMPVGGTEQAPRLHVVTLPDDKVDWTRTERYAASARFHRYADTRGEEDFALLTNDVARILNEIALNTDRAEALRLAEQARASLAEWPRSHFGYRQRDVSEILALLDEAISGLRVAAGQSQFELALVASPAETELEPLLGVPTPRDQIGQLMHVAELTPRVPERVSLFQAALALLAEVGDVIPSDVAEAYRQLAEDRIRTEQFIDGRYAALTERLMSSATRAAQSAQVRDVERVLERIPVEDDRLGRRRPDMIAALNASVLARLEDARRLRLLRDRWTLRRGLYREYRRSVGSELQQLVNSEAALRAVRDLHGPAPAVLLNLRGKLSGGAERLAREPVPFDLQGTHDLMVNAWRFAERALEARYQAVQTGNLETAWEASSAAAGSLLMLTRARQELEELLKPPQLQ